MPSESVFAFWMRSNADNRHTRRLCDVGTSGRWTRRLELSLDTHAGAYEHRWVSPAAAQSAAFNRDVARSGRVWTVRDAVGHPQPRGTDGARAQPYLTTTLAPAAVVTFSPEELAGMVVLVV
jgi:hypothetical protein